MLHAVQKADVDVARCTGLGRIRAGQLYVDAGGAQALQALAGYQRIGVLQGDHHAANASGDQRIAAGRRAPLMGAGLQRHIHRAACHRCTPAGRIAQRHDFGVGLASALGMAPANDPAVCRNDDATHPGIGVAQRHGLLRQLQRLREMLHGCRLSPCGFLWPAGAEPKPGMSTRSMNRLARLVADGPPPAGAGQW